MATKPSKESRRIDKQILSHTYGGLTFGSGPGGMKQIPTLDRFAGSLSGSGLSGNATGSFVNNGTVAADDIMGNWNVGSQNYQAMGIFGGVGTPHR
jgi:hypothetical protein